MSLGSHLAGVLALSPAHSMSSSIGLVVFSTPIVLVTNLAPHEGHLHLLQVVGGERAGALRGEAG